MVQLIVFFIKHSMFIIKTYRQIMWELLNDNYRRLFSGLEIINLVNVLNLLIFVIHVQIVVRIGISSGQGFHFQNIAYPDYNVIFEVPISKFPSKFSEV